MTGNTIFISGVYGTGKSTLCNGLTSMMKIPSFSAGDLISAINGERYGANKAVRDKAYNQTLLAEKVHELNNKHKRIILAGHFCIFNNSNEIEILPETVYFKLNISQIVLLETDVSIIANHLNIRDNKNYSIDNLLRLAEGERSQSEIIAQKLNCPLSVYRMMFSEIDVANVFKLISMEEKP